MNDCFPPVPLYIVAGILTAMFTTVASKIDPDAEVQPKGDLWFAAFLLLVLAIPFVQLVLALATVSGECLDPRSWETLRVNADMRWLLGFHAATISPLLLGAVYWFWQRSAVAKRLEPPAEREPATVSDARTRRRPAYPATS